MNTKEIVFLIMWITEVCTCLGIEVYVQYYENISGLGFIVALLLIPLILYDLKTLRGDKLT
jgi:hypothetical protein